MTGDDPFADLDQQLKESEEAAATAATGDEPESDEQAPEPEGGPAFEFDIDHQRSIYPRPESWEAYRDAIDFEVKRALADYGVRDLTGREAHDAMVRLAGRHPEALAALVLEARDVEHDLG